MTNILATLLVIVTTNTYAPKQYLSSISTLPILPGTSEWMDSPPYNWGQVRQSDSVRDNPDVRITEVRELRVLSFEFEGWPRNVEVENRLLSKTKSTRTTEVYTVITNETTTTISTARWIDENME